MIGKPMMYAEGAIPENYRCSKCGAFGVKLWRQSQTFLNHIKLHCALCALEAEGEAGPVDNDGRRDSEYGMTDQIGWLVPAVPDEECETYWGYTSIPKAGVKWWRKLPTSNGAIEILKEVDA